MFIIDFYVFIFRTSSNIFKKYKIQNILLKISVKNDYRKNSTC